MGNNFERTLNFLEKIKNFNLINQMKEAGERGVAALAAATPVDTGKTSQSWYYEIKKVDNAITLIFKNSNMAGSCSVAILIQYGHATPGGAWVEGRDFINPALKPIFNSLEENVWMEVCKP